MVVSILEIRVNTLMYFLDVCRFLQGNRLKMCADVSVLQYCRVIAELKHAKFFNVLAIDIDT